MITDPTAAFLLGVTITGVLALIGGYWLTEEHAKSLAIERARSKRLADQIYRDAVKVEQAERDAAGWARMWVAIEGDDNTVIEFPAGGRG